MPLVKKDGLPEIAKQIVEDLKWDFNVDYDEKDVQKDALPIRQELKKVTIDKLSKLLSTNDLIKVKKMKY